MTALSKLLLSGLGACSIACAVSSEEADNGTGGTATGTGGTSGQPVDGAGGTVASGGTGMVDGGTGGAQMPTNGETTCAAIDPNDLISDFESGEAKVIEVNGRSGSWFMSDDGTGSALPVKEPNTPLPAEATGACDSMYAFQTSGMGFSGWGALVATDLVPKVSDVKQPYDASAYSGIALRAKAADNLQLRIELATGGTMEEGGQCNPDAVTGDADRCGDHFGINVVLTSEWKDVVIPFTQLTQKGWGLPVTFDASKIYTVRLKVEGGDYDYSVDDVHFTK